MRTQTEAGVGTMRGREQAGLGRVATLVAREAPAEELFAAVSEEVARLLGAQTSNLYRFEPPELAHAVGSWNEPGAQGISVGDHLLLVGDTAMPTVLRTGRPTRIDDYSGLGGPLAERLRGLGIRSTVAAPIFVNGALWGAITASTTSSQPMPESAEERIAEFAELVAQALANREAQHLLRAERDFATTLVEITQALVCVFDPEGHILQFNSACETATGFAADEVVGRSACDFVIPPEQRDEFNAMLRHVWETGEPYPVRAQWLTKDGSRRDIEWSNRALLDESGRVTSFVTTGLDVTERVRATREIVRLAEEQAALRRVATLVASSPKPEAVFQAVAEEAGELIRAKSAATGRFEDQHGVTVGRWNEGEPRTSFSVGTAVPLEGSDGVTAVVWRTGEIARIPDYEGVRGEAARLMREAGYRTAVAAPISVEGRTWGALLVASEDPLGPDAEQRLGNFAELVALALQSAEAQEQLTASRARIVEASVAERRRLERNLHDGAQQRLVSLSLLLRLAQARVGEDPAAAEEMLAAGARDLQLALEELRELARGLHPAVLTDRGLGPALESLAARAPFPVEIGEVPPDRLGEAVEAGIYYVVAESLTNAAKHSGASGAWIALTEADGAAVVEIRDDGRGGADAAGGTGLRGLADRVEALGGRFELESPPGAGTTVRACLPLA